ncbi:hypothetical protein GOV09_06385, partial [Candidatus Woesearchaeota archaeon]|nr:hypothetical protein [Candidatus Woesearchaeota archaeon]
MRVLKTFEEFIKMREVIKRTPDLARADSLTQEAKKRKKFLAEMQDKIKLSDENANYFIEHAYDILMGLIRA